MSAKMISIEEARARILAAAIPLPAEERPLTEVLNSVLAEDITAPHSVPPFDNAGMDGFAVKAADTVEAAQDAPTLLRVTMTLPAGTPADGPIGPGEAAKIMTGAPLPEGADAVIQSELAEDLGSEVRILQAVKPGRNVRRAGEDVSVGDRVLAAGTVLGPAEIGVIASLGYPRIQVHRRPRVALISTGSELVEVDQPLGPGKIRNSNGYALRAQCQQLGIDADMLGIVPDDYECTRNMILRGLDYEVLLTSGGVSVGEFDFIKDIQDELGVERRLWGVSMKPGKPLAFGVRDRTLVFGLPGNPVSAMVSFELFVKPALLRLMGHRRAIKPTYRAVMAEDVVASDSRTYVVRVRAWRENEIWHVSSTGPQGSGMLRSMVGANGLAFVPGGPQGVRAGDEVDFLLLREDMQEP
ncbi:MAG: molybdopterin molybdotransferase MoeA [Actinobacteria bacterium]|nr:molybdopterin molybdotransferase MoeA [Actinomycetota bacterium]